MTGWGRGRKSTLFLAGQSKIKTMKIFQTMKIFSKDLWM